jgi:hypothetical protein
MWACQAYRMEFQRQSFVRFSRLLHLTISAHPKYLPWRAGGSILAHHAATTSWGGWTCAECLMAGDVIDTKSKMEAEDYSDSNASGNCKTT